MAQYEYFIHRIASVWMRMKWAKIRASYVIVKNSHRFRLNCPIQIDGHTHTNARNNNIKWFCESANANMSENCVWIPIGSQRMHISFLKTFFLNESKYSDRRINNSSWKIVDSSTHLHRNCAVTGAQIKWINRISVLKTRQPKTVCVYLLLFENA